MVQEKNPKENAKGGAKSKGKKEAKPAEDKIQIEEIIPTVEVDEKIIDEIDSKEVEILTAAVIKDDEELAVELKDIRKDTGKWVPKTEIGRKVKAGEITDIDEILETGKNILEAEIVDILMPNTESELLMIGQSKGKFGGGQKRVFRQTQKKTREGNKPSFATFSVIGDKDGHIGLGYGKARETVPAREKAVRNAKLNIMKIRRGCGSWECGCGTPHTIPFKVTGKCGSVIVTLMPAPKGTGLCAESEVAKVLKLAGIKDVWSKTRGQTGTKINHLLAAVAALKALTETKIMDKHNSKLSICEGNIPKQASEGAASTEA